MASITGSEKQNTAVGHGINLLEALRVSKEFISTTPIFDMDNITVDSITETHSDVVVVTENSKVDLAKSLSNDTVYSPLTAIDAYVNDQRPTSNEWSTVYWNGTFSIADVNYDAGGKYIYILQKHKQ